MLGDQHATAERRRPCPGCLGTHECWVCEGTGARSSPTHLSRCLSCLGTRICRYCRDDDMPRRRAIDIVLPVVADD